MNLHSELHLIHDKQVWAQVMKDVTNPISCIECGQCTTLSTSVSYLFGQYIIKKGEVYK